MAKTTGGGWIFPAVVVATAGAGVAAQSGVDPIGVWVFAVVLGGWVITLCLHEFAHAAVSYLGGDTSVKARGYLTLNPLRYTDLAYSIDHPDPAAGRRRHSAAGRRRAGGARPAAPPLVREPGVGGRTGHQHGRRRRARGDRRRFNTGLGAALSYLALLQFVAGILNLLPIPGFDGFGIIEPYLSRRLKERIRPLRPWIPLAVFAILFWVPEAGRWLFDAGYQLFELAGGSNYLAAPAPGCSGSGPETRRVRAADRTMPATTRWWNGRTTAKYSGPVKR